MTKITAPNKEFNGLVGDVQFEDGKATTDNEAVIDYCRGAGYTVGGKTATPPKEAPVSDARDFAEPQVVGTSLRDAAVDPHPEDFLAPTNAGKADPHGPEVVSPGIHGEQGNRPIKPGDVHVDDTTKQDAAETKHAVAATDGTPIVAEDPKVEAKKATPPKK